MTDLAQFISTIGFPIFVALILLLRVDRMHTENIMAMNALTATLQQLHLCLEKRLLTPAK